MFFCSCRLAKRQSVRLELQVLLQDCFSSMLGTGLYLIVFLLENSSLIASNSQWFVIVFSFVLRIPFWIRWIYVSQTSIYHLRLKKGNSHHSIWCISICHFIWFLYHFSSPCSYMNLNFSSCWLVFVGCSHLTWLSLCLECLPYLYVKNTIFFYFWIWLLGIIGNISLLQEIFLWDVLNLISLSC